MSSSRRRLAKHFGYVLAMFAWIGLMGIIWMYLPTPKHGQMVVWIINVGSLALFIAVSCYLMFKMFRNFNPLNH